MKNVLITGANGHLGFTITKYLSEKGYHVFAGVRDKSNKSKTRLLESLYVTLVDLDITNNIQVENAVRKVDGIIHTAAALSLSGKRQNIIDQTVNGAMNVIRAAHKANVKKIIYTSSSRVLGAVSTKEDPLNENSWNTNCKVPYFESKIIAEKEVFRYADENKMNVVCILPSIILGPNINRFSESTDLIRKIMENELPVIAPITFNFVDVRDAAKAHIAAYENKNAKGRYIIGNAPVTMNELFNTVSKYYAIKKPKIRLQRSGFITATYLMNLISFITARKPQTTPQQAIEFTKGNRYLDISRIKNEFGINLKPVEDTIKDTVNYILDKKLIAQNTG